MRVLVCGGRNFKDAGLFEKTLNKMHLPSDTVIIEGGATGVDQLASMWADFHALKSERFVADWKVHGKAAGPIRNRKMIEEGKPDLVIAFAGGRGTANMISQAKKANIKTLEVNPLPTTPQTEVE